MNLRNLMTGFLLILLASGCVTYSFTGTSIPSDVQTIHIPFFSDQSSGGIGDLGDRLNRVLINRFVNQSRLSQTSSQATADAFIQGAISGYRVRPFSISGDQQANLNEVTVTVRASFQYASEDQPLWSKTFSGSGTYDTRDNPVDGEIAAAEEALEQIATNMFNDAVSNW